MLLIIIILFLTENQIKKYFKKGIFEMSTYYSILLYILLFKLKPAAYGV